MKYGVDMRLIKHWVKYLAALILHYSGYNRFRLRQSRAHYSLLFHRISEGYDLLFMSLPPRFIQAVINWAESMGSVVPIDSVSYNDLCFSFSFDDGYQDNTQIPGLFGRHPVTLFLATAFIDSDRTFWAVELQDRLMYSKSLQLDLSQFGLGIHYLNNVEQRHRCLYELNVKIKALRPDIIDQVMIAVARQMTYQNINTTRQFLSWSDVRSLRNQGVSIGAHTHTHIITTHVSDEELINDIQLSTSSFKRELHTTPSFFAYPNGRSEDICTNGDKLLRRMGYTCAVTTIEGPNLPSGNIMRIKRFNMSKNRLMTPWGTPSKAMFSSMLANPFDLF